MVIIRFDKEFRKHFSKIDNSMKEKVLKQISKIQLDPECGKPMSFARKGTRDVYISSYRLSYNYLRDENKIIITDLYHKDEQ